MSKSHRMNIIITVTQNLFRVGSWVGFCLPGDSDPGLGRIRKGPNGVSTNWLTAKFMFFDRDFWGTPVYLI